MLRRWAGHLSATHEVVMVSHRWNRPGATPSAGAPSGAEDPFDTVPVHRTADLAEVLSTIAPDVVSLHNRPQWWSHAPSSAQAVVTFHNFSPAWKLTSSGVRDVRTAVASGALRASAVSGALASAAGGIVAAPVAVTPPSIAAEFFEPSPRRPERVVLSPNRLMVKKGVMELLEMARLPEFADVQFSFADLISPWSRATREHRSLRLAIDGVDNADRFRPASGPADLAERYGRCGVVACVVNEAEGLGLVALEAQACGVPLVTTDLGGLREATFAPNSCVAPGDPAALASGLSAALLRSQESCEPARSQVARRYTPEASGERYREWVEGSLRPGGRGHTSPRPGRR